MFLMLAHRTDDAVQSGLTKRIGGILLRSYPRVMGIFTIAYAVWVLSFPEAMLVPTELSSNGSAPETALLARTMLFRDLVCGLAMILAPAGAPLLTAIAIRVGSDMGDTMIMGTSLPSADSRESALVVAGSFGVLCALSAFGARRRAPR